MKRILICGSRSWTNPRPIRIVLERLLEDNRKEDLLVIVGGATGVDLTAEEVCTQLGIHTARVKALWDTYRRSAGPRRNGVMLSLEPEIVFAFHFSRERLAEEGSGTGRCIEQAKAKGIPVRVKMVRQEVADEGAAIRTTLAEEKAASKQPRRKKS